VKPSTPEELLERSEKSSVKADAIWLTISKFGEGAAMTVIDLNREGSCFVLKDERGTRTITGGAGVPKDLVERAFALLTRRNVIYGVREKGTSNRDSKLLSLGLASWDGSRVYKSKSGTIESYPKEVQEIIADLELLTSRLPVNPGAQGSIRATFLRPSESRRLAKTGKNIIAVADPGRDARIVSPLEMALRFPGRDVVSPTLEDWSALQTYLTASNPSEPNSDVFYVRSSSRVFSVKMSPVTKKEADRPAGEVPRARPVPQ